nr:hypothetical protein [Tanacetum cinerariifolium]
MEIPIFEGSPITRTESQIETYKTVSQDIRDQLNAEAEAVQIILTGIDNDIYSTIDACPNAFEIWKAIERLKHGESINVQDLKTNLFWEFGKFTSQDGESLESYYSRFYKMMNELIRNQCVITNHQVNVQFLLQLQPKWQRFVTLVKQSQELKTDKEIDKLMALISLSFKKIYKPTNNNLQTSSNTSRANQDNSPRINRSAGYENQKIGNVAGARETVGSTVVQKSGIQCYNCKEFRHVAWECQKPKKAKDAAYYREKMLLCKQEEAGIQLNAEQVDWRDDTDDDELEDQELEAHYMYMAQLQEVSPDAADSGPIFDAEPLQKVSNDDNYNVFAIESAHPEQLNLEEIDQNDDDNDLANEREFLASLIEKLKCEINESKNRNKFLETSNKVLVEKLKGEIEDLKNKNKSLESSNNYFKEVKHKLSEINNLLYTDYKKSEAELARRNSMEYASQMEIKCAQVRGDFLSHKMESQKSFKKYTQTINDLNQTISEMKDKLSAHQKTISIPSKQKEAQIKLYKTREDKELDKVIALENKVKRYFLERSRLSHTSVHNGNSKEPFIKQTTLLEKRMDESIPWYKKCRSSIENFKVKTYVNTIFNGVELCKEKIAHRTYSGYIDPFIQNTIEANFYPEIRRINAGLAQFHKCLNEEMVTDLRYFNSIELEVDYIRSQLETQKTQFLNEIDRLSKEYYYADHINAILGVYTELDETLPPNKKYILKNMNVLALGMYKLHTEPTQARKPQLPQDSRKTNKRVSFSTGVIPTTSVSRPQLKSNLLGDRVMRNNSQGKKHGVEDQRRSVKLPKNKTSVTACNDSLNAKTLNVNSMCATCDKCVLNDKHDMCVLNSVAKPIKKIVASESNKKPRNITRKLYERITCRDCPIHRRLWVLKAHDEKSHGLNHNLFFVGQFCDADLEVAFRKSTCYIRDLKGNDLLT